MFDHTSMYTGSWSKPIPYREKRRHNKNDTKDGVKDRDRCIFSYTYAERGRGRNGNRPGESKREGQRDREGEREKETGKLICE